MMKRVSVGSVTFSNQDPFVLIAGPCVMETRDHALMMVDKLTKLTEKHAIPFVFKSSFDKANRTSVKGERGIGLDNGMKVFEEIKENYACPVITDVHTAEQCSAVADYVDMLQIPAFLCRQTDLLQAAAETKCAINIKKGQFLAPHDMKQIITKMEAFGNENILLCERGVSFGYNALVNDMRGLAIMAQTTYPVVFDATHSVQEPGGAGHASSGKRVFAPILGRAALAVGVAAIFAETHQDPDNAPSDGPNMIRLEELDQVLKEWKIMDDAAKANPRFLPH